MLNLDIGSGKVIDGRTCILTHAGAGSHAVYGPYAHLKPGRYVVEFNLMAAEQTAPDGDDICAPLSIPAQISAGSFSGARR